MTQANFGDANIEILDPKSFSGVVADEIVASIQERLEESDTCTLVLAGGSTPSAIYRMLARPPRAREIPWNKVHLFWGDERWVPHTDTHSNYNMVMETLLTQVQIPKENVHPIDTAASTPEEGARLYEETIRKALKLSAGEMPKFDLVLLGVGKDGHTASLFPGSSKLSSVGSICHSVQRPDTEEYRVTLSSEVLVSASRILFIVTGDGKADIVRRTLEGNETVDEIPAKILEQSAERVRWFIDSAAARALTNKSA